MATNKRSYAERINTLLEVMPEFTRNFIFSFDHTGQTATMFEYCRDMQDFFQFLTSEYPELMNKEIKDLTLADLERLKPDDINRYLDSLRGSKDKRLNDSTSGTNKPTIKISTIKRRRATLSSMFSYFVKTEKLPRNPVLATKSIKPAEKELIYLTNDEQRLLLNTVRSGDNLTEKETRYHSRYEERDSALFLLLLDTGLRVSEMLSTDLADYDLDNCSVLVRRKSGEIQTVFYSDECALYLDAYFTSQRSRYLLSDHEIPAFTTLKGDRLGVRAVENLVKKYVTACMPKKAKLISPNKLRSSFAMSFYAANQNNISLLQKKMDHKTLLATNVYAKASDNELEASRNSLQGLR